MIVAGVDCGAQNTKTVIMKNHEIIARAKVHTGFDQAAAVKESLDSALTAAGITREMLDRTGGTGSGRNAVEQADAVINTVKAMALCAGYYFPSARTVIDVGAEEGRAVRLTDSGAVQDFAVNEKCAAGAGAFLEAMARALETPLEEMGPLALTSDNSIPMNAQCAIFAESEVVGLIHANTSKNDISKAIHDAMANRIVSMIRRIGIDPDIAMIGGTACNPGLVEALKRELAIDRILIPEYPEYGAAVGAASAASEQG